MLSCWRRPIECGHGPSPEVGTGDPAVMSPSQLFLSGVVTARAGHGLSTGGRQEKRTKHKAQENTSAYGGMDQPAKGPGIVWAARW